MEKELRPGRRTSASLLGKISVVVLKTLAALVLIALLAVFVTSVSPIYDFLPNRGRSADRTSSTPIGTAVIRRSAGNGPTSIPTPG